MCASHYSSILELVESWGMLGQFPEVVELCADPDKYYSHMHEHFHTTDRDFFKVLTISIAYQCQRDETWHQKLLFLHREIAFIVDENARRNPKDVAVAKSWGKKRPKVTAFAYRLCHLERLKLGIMIHAAGNAAMCPEYDGLVLFSDDLDELQKAVVQVEKSVKGLRKLKVKPYAETLQQWLAKAAARYPNEDWTVKSKFPWKDLATA
jgi:hypothetical protein